MRSLLETEVKREREEGGGGPKRGPSTKFKLAKFSPVRLPGF
jgi:hypothetical protein